MLIPYSTDAPIYHWPFATVGLMAANVVVFAVINLGGYVEPDSWMLSYGNGVHPEQWLSSIFLHAGPMHLIGNLIFLWVFGLVVEGKLGWWRFLCCYLAVGMGQMAIQQFVMLGYEGELIGALGASGAIFGLIAMAMIWAPVNEITCFYLFGFSVGTFDISIALLAGLYTGWELLMICIFGGDAGSSWLHLTGFVLGLPLGIVLLKRGLVDCEGWDAFHVWRGETGAFKKQEVPAEVFAKVDSKRKEQDENLLGGAKQQFQQFLQQGNTAAAIKLYEKMQNIRSGIQPTRDQWLTMIQFLHKEKRWAESAPLMAKLIATSPENADLVRLKLAQICVVELQKPGKALDLLRAMNAKKLPEKQVELFKRIRSKATEMQEEGVVELDDDAW